MRERERLIARIRQVRRASRAPEEAASPVPEQDQLLALERRLTHLETLVQGLQDSVHRESSRQAKRIAELEARIKPEAIGRALSEDARTRGL